MTTLNREQSRAISTKYDMRAFLAVKPTDVMYEQTEQLMISLILRADSYKFSHAFAYPKDVVGMAAYIEARTNGKDLMIPFGLQILLKRFLTQRITRANVATAKAFAEAHGDPFAEDDWLYIVEKYNGAIPLTIRAVPEGTPVRSGNAMVSIICFDERVFWLAAYFETLIQRGIWYPTTIASMDYIIKRELKHLYEITGADMGLLPFALHDFGARGVTCGEQAEIGGAAHLVNFMGSDNVEGTVTANFYYKEAMASFSVPATEHSVECSFGGGSEQEIEYLRHVLKYLAKPGGIVSIVIDGYDVYRCAEALCTVLRDEIIACQAKVVFRPDSGDMMEVVPRILRMQEMAFGVTITSKGYKKINHVGIIQGDGVDHLSIGSLLGKIINVLGYSADCVIFGSGGALLQKVNRDTFKFAQKASSILREVQGVLTWVGIAKDPVTDQGKKSKEGVLTLVKSKMTNEVLTMRIDEGPLDEEWEDMMVLVYENGCLYNETVLSEVRARVA